jgi:hypothetical protein
MEHNGRQIGLGFHATLKINIMTNQFLEQKFKELIYNFGEVNWNIIKTKSWDKYINNQESFSEKQFEDLRHFVKDLLDCLTDEPKHEKLSQSAVISTFCQCEKPDWCMETNDCGECGKEIQIKRQNGL